MNYYTLLDELVSKEYSLPMVKSPKSNVATETFVKNEVEKLRVRMDSKFADVDEKFQEIDENFEGVNMKLDRVLTQLDSIAGQFKKFDEERELMSDKIKQHMIK